MCSNLCDLSQEESKSKNNLPLLATLSVKVSSNSRKFCTYALLDSGSQQTFCNRKLADKLNLKCPNHVMRLRAMSQTGEQAALKGS